ncbi:hypothetical protein SUDANB178_06612 [Streptomyces sp. enrichment culture]
MARVGRSDAPGMFPRPGGVRRFGAGRFDFDGVRRYAAQWAPSPPPPNEPLEPLLQRGRSFDALGRLSMLERS